MGSVTHRPLRTLAALWGVAGFTLLLTLAIQRLAMQALAAIDGGLGPLQWAILVAFALAMAYLEGYRGFQQRYAPRFARRIITIRDGSSALEAVLAPLFAMGFFRATRRELVTTYLLLLLVLAFVFLFRSLPQPWRGVLDAGVVIGLAWGVVASWAHVAHAWRRPVARPTAARVGPLHEG